MLKGEHRVIEQVLACLEKIVEEANGSQTLAKGPAGNAVDFFRNFADRCHHGKEEDNLFPAMEAKGFPREGGPTGVMRFEHEQGRSHVRAMAEAIEPASAGDAAALKRFSEHAGAYIALLREHIQKEDHCLFGMAEQAFAEEDHRRLAEAFERVESEHMGEGTHERYLQIADELAERYGVPKASEASEALRHCGCGHQH
jgi:hemerythrin-like domain-containing protein